MTASATTRQHFAGRYLVARYETGGVVIDVQSGNYFRVNRTAALVCDALAREPSEPAAAHRVARELRIDASEGTKLVDEVLSGLNAPVFHGEPQGSYHFYPSDSGYELRHGQPRVLEISSDGSQVRIAPGAPPVPEAQLELYVRALAPKLLFQRSVRVFHASSCVVGGALIAFAGVGAPGRRRPRAHSTRRAPSWCRRTCWSSTRSRRCDSARRGRTSGSRMGAQDDRPAAAPPSSACFSGNLGADGRPGTHPSAPVESCSWTAQRPAGSDFRTAPLGEADALAELLRHDFLLGARRQMPGYASSSMRSLCSRRSASVRCGLRTALMASRRPRSATSRGRRHRRRRSPRRATTPARVSGSRTALLLEPHVQLLPAAPASIEISSSARR